jgi:hypothetical protein
MSTEDDDVLPAGSQAASFCPPSTDEATDRFGGINNDIQDQLV